MELSERIENLGGGGGAAYAGYGGIGLFLLAIFLIILFAAFRQHNNGNVVCLSGRFVDLEVNKQIVKTFLTTEFEGGRHERRVEKIMALDTEEA